MSFCVADHLRHFAVAQVTDDETDAQEQGETETEADGRPPDGFGVRFLKQQRSDEHDEEDRDEQRFELRHGRGPARFRAKEISTLLVRTSERGRR